MLADWLRQSPQRVHLWRIGLAAGWEEARPLQTVLSTAERQRALRFATESLAGRFIVCRAATRLILAQYLSRKGERLKFRRHAMGKPYLASRGRACPLRFNVSHSRDLAVLAVTWRQEVGVDIEAVRPVPNLERMVRRCLGPLEQSHFYGNGVGDSGELFLWYWTHKEAYLKATGHGLPVPLSAIQVELRENEPARIVSRPSGGVQGVADICMTAIRPHEGYCGALAVQGDMPPEIQYWDWRS